MNVKCLYTCYCIGSSYTNNKLLSQCVIKIRNWQVETLHLFETPFQRKLLSYYPYDEDNMCGKIMVTPVH